MQYSIAFLGENPLPISDRVIGCNNFWGRAERNSLTRLREEGVLTYLGLISLYLTVYYVGSIMEEVAWVRKDARARGA